MTRAQSPDFRLALATRGATHWWSAGMRRITWSLLGGVQGRLLDVGCGPGWELAELPVGAWGVGVDLQVNPHVYTPLLLADAGRLPLRAETFDLVLALDLLEQRGVDPAAVLAEVRRVLRPGGRLLVRVPAHPSLQGPHDAFWGGAQRYRRAELARLIEGSDLTVRRLTYVNCLLFLPALVERLLARTGLQGGDDLQPAPSCLNRFLFDVLVCEAWWLRRLDLPMGLSLACLAERVAPRE